MTKIKYAGDVEATGGVVRGSTAVIGADPGGTEAIRATGGIRHTVARAFAGAANAITDDCATGATTILNNGTLSISGMLYGMIDISESGAIGGSAMIVVSQGGTAIGFQTSHAEYSVTAATAGKVNVFGSAGNVTIENKTGSTIMIRTHIRRLG